MCGKSTAMYSSVNIIDSTIGSARRKVQKSLYMISTFLVAPKKHRDTAYGCVLIQDSRDLFYLHWESAADLFLRCPAPVPSNNNNSKTFIFAVTRFALDDFRGDS